MNLRNLLFALAFVCVGVAIGMAAMQNAWHEWLYAQLPFLLASIIIGTFVLVVAGWIAYVLLKMWVRRTLNIKGDLTGEQVVTGLANTLTNREALDNPDAQDRMHSLMVNLGLYYVRSVAMQRYLLIVGGLFTTLIGMATVFLLYKQNEKIDFQTRQIEIQSQANTVASLLMEGTRRAALASEQTALFADIRAEAAAMRENNDQKSARACAKPKENESTNHLRACWREVELPNKTKIELVHLSDDLFQRVRAYALRATPYPIASKKSSEQINIKTPLDDQFDFPELSPERGQLLQTLVMNRVDANLITFEKAALEGLDLSNAYLVAGEFFSIKFMRADLTNADLRGANLALTNFTEADFTGANLSEVNLTTAYLVGADLSFAALQRADLTRAHLISADLKWANLKGANLQGADLSKAVLTRANLAGADLTGIQGLPNTNDGRRQALDAQFQNRLALSRGVDKAILPTGFTASCSKPVEENPFFGNTCPAEGGWTITYTDQPEFE